MTQGSYFFFFLILFSFGTQIIGHILMSWSIYIFMASLSSS